MRAPWDTIGTRSWFASCAHGGGGSSSSATNETTANQDQRAAADTGSVSASGGASLRNVAVYNTSSDPAVIMAALQSVEQSSAAASGTVGDLAAAALHENRALSQEAIDQWAQIVEQSLGAGAQSIHDAISAIATQSASNSALASQALTQASPFSSSLKYLVLAGAAVVIVFFLSRTR